MDFGQLSPLEWLVLVERELIIFAGVFFLLGSLDELIVDGLYVWARLTGRAGTRAIDRDAMPDEELSGMAAVFIPTWREENVIGATVAHALAVWPQQELRIYVGCYANDRATPMAVAMSSMGDPRLKVVILEQEGPTTKADCLNGLYAALERDERDQGIEFNMVILHDAEDMVDPAALGVLDLVMEDADFVQLPVVPETQKESRWVGNHYCEEFAEAHAKAMVVRDALGASIPSAGVGCAIARSALGELAEMAEDGHPFSVESLTEDYELGMRIREIGGYSRFVRLRGDEGRLIATRAYFPDRLDRAVRQKTRWIHGIALQGWDRMGWHAHPIELWMRLRDRRGPMTALVLGAAYLLLIVGAILWMLPETLVGRDWVQDPLIYWLLVANFAGFIWRAATRFAFTAREYGAAEGAMAVLRIPLANIIAIMAGRRALFAYLGTLSGQAVRWDKTEHSAHPASAPKVKAQ